ncbi:General transcription factor II-I repeat domain-containing protein 2 [Thelohanellus kitauei]|uniref:General transcription factor II-I repeat domain-containing protein 2 n=1 Tax=Thelohanellus kitauei TaxID=669202 RepID=A0A0C2N806_THEKT|nr:General transcription factor II-I repeat domain-containing protein 2 [Thelohanellus kitauei]
MYFFTEVDKNAVCLLGNRSVSMLKEYNITRHYVTKHADYGSTLSTGERPTRAKELDRKLVKQQNIFRKDKIQQKYATRSSFVVTYYIAKQGQLSCNEITSFENTEKSLNKSFCNEEC